MDDLVRVIKEATAKEIGTRPYDTTAIVTRVKDNTAYVHIGGGVSETPVNMTINCKAGDTVKVHIANTGAWITGNMTRPPTDDAEAITAKVMAKMGAELAEIAKETADSKVRNFVQSTAPETGMVKGDTWTDTDDQMIYTYDGDQWVQTGGGEDAVLLRIDSSRGTVFKNNSVQTVLSVVIFKGGQRMTTISEVRAEFGQTAYIEWWWQRLDDDRFGLISADDSRIGNGGMSFTLSPSDVDTKVTFQCNLITD